eukprot:CAMPEP_0117666218 /NCGR_PEP_ID=MMETSP0804-20121206/10251_1 /TAXON_ID=1074897 /ORGANISM="Tetraselmis astigmatica, Strain CCMP880" /LENGTH=391 /DNA_ID=CAMNT_0005473733 /DNA_START=246 /DNA_END=1422 /DNA_ORIENTATION=-
MTRINVKSNMEDRTFAVNRAGISVGAMAPPAAGGLPALQTHDAQSAHHFTAINPLHGVSANAAQEHNRRKDVELQQLSGASSLHPLLSDYRNETESRFMKSNIMQRIIVAVCVLLTALLCGMVAYEVNEVIKESSERLTAQGGESSQHWTVADCHWTQIRLPTSLSAADVTVQVKFRQPSAPYEIIEEFAELGREYNYCFLVDTQGANPVIGAALEDTDERGTIKTTGQTGIYVMLFKHPLHSSKEIGTLKIFFRKTSPSARLAPAPMEIQAVAEEVECWKECIEYNSVCDDEFAMTSIPLAGACSSTRTACMNMWRTTGRVRKYKHVLTRSICTTAAGAKLGPQSSAGMASLAKGTSFCLTSTAFPSSSASVSGRGSPAPAQRLAMECVS